HCVEIPGNAQRGRSARREYASTEYERMFRSRGFTGWEVGAFGGGARGDIALAQGATDMESRQRDAMPPLVRISQVEENFATDSALAVVARWVREYLMRPHPQLGRRGAVCPFVPISIELDTMW